MPGHEIVGTDAALGAQAKGLKLGQRVGVGWVTGSCMHCGSCIGGDQHLCESREQTIVGRHGGFAERVRAHWAWAFPLPEGLDGAILKCQETKVPGDETGGAGPKEIRMPVCIWGDHSTLGVTINANIADALAGKGADLEAAAEQTAKFRKEVRVKA